MNDIITRYYDEQIQVNRSLDIACPETIYSNTALVFIHGGGWARGAKDQFHYHFEYFTDQGYLCASLGYRLVPEVSIKEQMADIVTGYDHCLSFIRERALDINTIIIIGGSAGAHLGSLAALQSPENYIDSSQLENVWIPPAGCIAIHGPASLEKWPDMHPHMKNCIEDLIKAKYSDEEELFARYSPNRNISKDSPPFLFLLAGLEEFFPNDEVLAMSERMRDMGIYTMAVTFPRVRHGFLYELSGAVQRKALAVMEDFIRHVRKG